MAAVFLLLGTIGLCSAARTVFPHHLLYPRSAEDHPRGLNDCCQVHSGSNNTKASEKIYNQCVESVISGKLTNKLTN